jgi:hypothetical protein
MAHNNTGVDFAHPRDEYESDVWRDQSVRSPYGYAKLTIGPYHYDGLHAAVAAAGVAGALEHHGII